MSYEIRVIRQPNGDWVHYGRHASVGGVRGHGPMIVYTGEDARVLDRLLLKGDDKH